MPHNVGACDRRGLGGLAMQRSGMLKPTSCKRVHRYKPHKDSDSYEDTEPPPGTSTLLVAVWPSPHFICGSVFRLSDY